MTTKSSTSKKTIDAHIIEKTTSTPIIDDVEEQKFKPPPLPQTNNPFVLLGLSPSANFDAVKRAYKDLVKLYHPDVAVGPDASSDERKQANWDFARINAAYDILKRRENEEVFEYEIYVDGKQETRKVSLDKDQRRKDAHYIDYDRIREVAEYRERHPKKKMWYEEDHEYQPNTNGFETSESSFCSNEKWWNHLETFEYEYENQADFPGYDGSFVSTQETMRREGFGFGTPYYGRQAEEPFWHNRHTFTKHVDDGRWWHDGWHDNTICSHNDRWYNAAVEYDFGMRNGHDAGYFEPIQYNPNDTWYRTQYDDTEPQCNGDFGP